MMAYGWSLATEPNGCPRYFQVWSGAILEMVKTKTARLPRSRVAHKHGKGTLILPRHEYQEQHFHIQ